MGWPRELESCYRHARNAERQGKDVPDSRGKISSVLEHHVLSALASLKLTQFRHCYVTFAGIEIGAALVSG